MDPVSVRTDDAVRLEGELRMPDTDPRGLALLCHAHPRHGGSKDHPILWALRNELAGARGFAVLGLNFRGVMGSGGSYGGGRDEVRDVRAGVSFLRDSLGEALPTLIAGWSFGASVGLREALDDRRVHALALIGLPLRPADLQLPPLPDPVDLRRFGRPAILLSGELDGFCPPDELTRYGSGFRSAEVVILEGTDHFLWRREKEAAGAIGAFADRIAEG